MKKGLTELVFILDKSGSMSGLEADTIGGYNSMLRKQQSIEGECHITTVLFNNNYELLHDRIDIKAVGPITVKEYQVGGSTALLDAIGSTIHKIGNSQKHTAEDYRAEKVMFVIITEGEETPVVNTLRKMSKHRLKGKKQNMAGSLSSLVRILMRFKLPGASALLLTERLIIWPTVRGRN